MWPRSGIMRGESPPLAPGGALESTHTAHAGPLAMIGGRLEPDNAALFYAMRTRCRGRIAVLAMASGYPEEVGAELVEDFTAHGVEAELIPLFFENRETAAFVDACVGLPDGGRESEDPLRVEAAPRVRVDPGQDVGRPAEAAIGELDDSPSMTAAEQEVPAVGDLLAGSFIIIVGGQDPLS